MSNELLKPQELLALCKQNFESDSLTLEDSDSLKTALEGYVQTYPAVAKGLFYSQSENGVLCTELNDYVARLFMQYLDDLVKLNQTVYVKTSTFNIQDTAMPKAMQAALYKAIPYYLNGPWCVTVDKDLRQFSRRYLAEDSVSQIEKIKRITERRLRYIAPGSPVSIVGGGDNQHRVGILCEAKGDIHLGWTECTIAFSAGGNLVEYATYHRSEIRPFSTQKKDLDKIGQSLWDTLEAKLVKA